MVKIIFQALTWTLLGGQTLVSLLKCLFLAKKSSRFVPTTSKDLVILGNGPSLTHTLTQDLTGYELMAVNLFACSDAFQQFKPSFYIWLDPAFADPIHPAGSKARQALVEQTTWPLVLWVPTSFQKSACFQSEIVQNEFIAIHYFNYVICEGFTRVKHALFKQGWGMPQCQNVLLAALFTGIQMKFKLIWLTGADHSWHEDIRLTDENELQFFDTHFYEKEKNITNLSKTATTSESHLSRVFLSLHKVYRGYEVLATYAHDCGVTVRNASTKSYIDVFPKLPFT